MSATLLTVAEAAAELGVSRGYVRELIDDGLVVGRRRGPRGRWYVVRASMDEWVTSGRAAPEPVVFPPMGFAGRRR